MNHAGPKVALIALRSRVDRFTSVGRWARDWYGEFRNNRGRRWSLVYYLRKFPKTGCDLLKGLVMLP